MRFGFLPRRPLQRSSRRFGGFFWIPAALAQTRSPSFPILVEIGQRGGDSFPCPFRTLLFIYGLVVFARHFVDDDGLYPHRDCAEPARQALGTQSSPPNQVIIGLSLFLTLFVMGPTLDRVYEEAYLPYTENAMQL